MQVMVLGVCLAILSWVAKEEVFKILHKGGACFWGKKLFCPEQPFGEEWAPLKKICALLLGLYPSRQTDDHNVGPGGWYFSLNAICKC